MYGWPDNLKYEGKRYILKSIQLSMESKLFMPTTLEECSAALKRQLLSPSWTTQMVYADEQIGSILVITSRNSYFFHYKISIRSWVIESNYSVGFTAEVESTIVTEFDEELPHVCVILISLFLPQPLPFA